MKSPYVLDFISRFKKFCSTNQSLCTNTMLFQLLWLHSISYGANMYVILFFLITFLAIPASRPIWNLPVFNLKQILTLKLLQVERFKNIWKFLCICHPLLSQLPSWRGNVASIRFSLVLDIRPLRTTVLKVGVVLTLILETPPSTNPLKTKQNNNARVKSHSYSYFSLQHYWGGS